MRFLANENFPWRRCQGARGSRARCDLGENCRTGTSDSDVLAWARREERILLTFDEDFGEVARRSALPAKCGVVVFRIPAETRRGGTASRGINHIA